MRALIFVAVAALALGGCGNNDQKDNTINVDENLTAENIVSNDVTAIDAVTGDAANMAADVDMNYGNLDENAAGPTTMPAQKAAGPMSNISAPRAARPATKPAAPEQPSNTTSNTAAAATNAE
jgi:major membrane immunogen (membrane-anchored lipoprotein)